MPAIATIDANKELVVGYPPILLVDIAFYGTTTTLHLCSRAGAHSSINYYSLVHASTTYLARLAQQNWDSIQAFSNQGLDTLSAVTFEIADGDTAIWTYEQTFGFQGAMMVCTLVMWDPVSGNYSSDTRIPFSGFCDAAQRKETLKGDNRLSQVVTVRAVSIYNLSRKLLPQVPVQNRCPWVFPANTAQRLEGITTPQPFSIFNPCGYAPDYTGAGFPFGNFQSGTTPFTSCDFTKTACQARGMFSTDHLGHSTMRFGGVSYDPPSGWKGKSYIDQKTNQGYNNPNVSKFSQWYPETYGATWVKGIVMNNLGDPNSSRFEVVVQYLSLNTRPADDWLTRGITKVLVNNILIPPSNATSDLLFRWYGIASGETTGGLNGDAPYNNQGDPYGSRAVIHPVVYASLQDSTSIPDVEILVGDLGDKTGGGNGRPLPVYSAGGSYTFSRTDLLGDVVLDILMRSGMPLSAFDMQSVVNYRALCAAAVTYTNLFGNTATHRQYGVSLAITQRKSVSAIIAGLRVAGKLMIVPNANGTKIRFVGKQTLAAQQPAPMAGSNYNTAVPSINAAGSAANGYYAYWFNDSNIIIGTLQFSQNTTADSANSITAQIYDEDNDHQPDSVTVSDPVAIGRSSQTVQGTLTVDGLPNWDQAYRIIQTNLAESFRGNPRSDSGGTYIFTFDSTIKGIDLNAGDIVRFSNAQLAVDNAFRVLKIQPKADFETITFTLQWHEDAWYTYTYGQADVPIYGTTGQRNANAQILPYSWQPNKVPCVAPDYLYSGARGAGYYKTFDLQFGTQTSGDSTALVGVEAIGYLPPNQPGSAVPPALAAQGTFSSSGGTIQGGFTIYVYAEGYDVLGNTGPLGRTPCTIAVGLGSPSNTITVPILFYPAGTVGIRLFAGILPNFLTMCADFPTSVPTSVTITGIQATGQGPQDLVIDHLRLRAKQVPVPGRWILTATNAPSPTTLGIHLWRDLLAGTSGTAPPADHTLDGMDMICAFGNTADVPFVNLRIASQIGSVITINTSIGTVDLMTLGLVGSSWIVTGPPGTVTANTIQVAGATSSALLAAQVGNLVRIIAGNASGLATNIITAVASDGTLTVATPWAVLPDATSRFIIEAPTWEAQSSASSVAAPGPGTVLGSIFCPLSNYAGVCWFIQAASWNKDETKQSIDFTNPFRFLYAFGTSHLALSSLAAPGNVVSLGVPTVNYQVNGTEAQIIFTYVKPTGTGETFDRIWLYIYDPADSTTSADKPKKIATPFLDSSSAGTITFVYKVPGFAFLPDSIVIYAVSGSANVENAWLATDVSVTVILVNAGLGAPGVEYAPLVDSFALSTALISPSPFYSIDSSGNYQFKFGISFFYDTTSPAQDALQAGCYIVQKNPLDNSLTDIAPMVTSLGTGGNVQVVTRAEQFVANVTMTLYAVSVDKQGRRNTIVAGTTPTITVTINPNTMPSGTERSALVTGFSAVPTSFLDSNGATQIQWIFTFTAPADARFGGCAVWILPASTGVRAEAHRFTLSPGVYFTPSPKPPDSWTIYFVSYDKQGRLNSIVTGVTPNLVFPTVGSAVGTLNLAAAASASFSTQFTIVGGVFQVSTLNASLIQTGELQVGGFTGMPSLMKVFDGTGNLCGFIGDANTLPIEPLLSGGSTPGGGYPFIGGWFKTLKVGGTDPTNAPLTADTTGKVTLLNGSIYIQDTVAVGGYYKTIAIVPVAGSGLQIQLSAVAAPGGATNSLLPNAQLNQSALFMDDGGGAVSNAVGLTCGTGGGLALTNNSRGVVLSFIGDDRAGLQWRKFSLYSGVVQPWLSPSDLYLSDITTGAALHLKAGAGLYTIPSGGSAGSPVIVLDTNFNSASGLLLCSAVPGPSSAYIMRYRWDGIFAQVTTAGAINKLLNYFSDTGWHNGTGTGGPLKANWTYNTVTLAQLADDFLALVNALKNVHGLLWP